MRNRTELLDNLLEETIYFLFGNFFFFLFSLKKNFFSSAKFIGQPIQSAKAMAVSAFSEMLYDEMVFRKVLSKVNKNYLQEISRKKKFFFFFFII